MTAIAHEQVFYAKKHARLAIGSGAVLVILGFFALLTAPAPLITPITLGVAMLGVGCLSHFSPLIRFGGDYIVLNRAPLARTRTILDSEIQSVEQKRKVIVLHYKRHDDNPEKPLRKSSFHMNMLTAKDREACMKAFAARFEITKR